MRSVVYNRYWGTGGGAETYGGLLAQCLTERGPVELVTHEDVDLGWLAERLRLDLSACRLHLVEDSPSAIAAAAGDADLFVNVSFMSRDVAPSPRSLYVVHFPTGPELALPSWKRRVVGAARRVPNLLPPASLEWWQGFHTPEVGGRGVVWTDGEGVLRIAPGDERPVEVRVSLGFQRPESAGPTDVVVEAGGEVLARTVLDGPAGQVERRLGRTLRFTLPATSVGEPVPVHIHSGSFVPDQAGQGGDHRRLGVPIVGVQVGAGPGGLLARALPVLISQPLSNDWARSYGTIVANSAFTQGWVRRRWGLDSTVLHPPVRMRETGAKERSILNVGRFFGEGLGHSKRQLDLVTAFRQLVDGGLAGWTLHLAGGCSDEGRSYLDAVRQHAEGYPVELHVEASGSEIDHLYQAAAIYWHASGLGVDPERRPDVLEHFGISTVEAMSAGAVPVVVGLGGLVETVRHGVDGYHFQTIDGLASITARLAADPGAVARLSASARRRAQAFSVDAFAERFDRIVTDLLESHPPPMTIP